MTQKIINVIVIQPPIRFQHLKRKKFHIQKLVQMLIFLVDMNDITTKNPFFLNLRKFGTVALEKKKIIKFMLSKFRWPKRFQKLKKHAKNVPNI